MLPLLTSVTLLGTQSYIHLGETTYFFVCTQFLAAAECNGHKKSCSLLLFTAVYYSEMSKPSGLVIIYHYRWSLGHVAVRQVLLLP